MIMNKLILILIFLISSCVGVSGEPKLPPTLGMIIEWDYPFFRENGVEFTPEEIGGIEILYRKLGETYVEHEIIREPDAVSPFTIIVEDAGKYEITLAVFDTNGVYSKYSDPKIIEIGEINDVFE